MKIKLNKFVILAILFGVISISPVFIRGIPVGADLINHFRFVLPFYDELAQGNLFPGWLAESNYGFGDPRFRFYPPVFYYLLCGTQFFLNDWFLATTIVITLFAAVGTLGVYSWARQTFSNQTAVLASFIFALIPYHLTQFYQASLLAEFAATSVLPFCFKFVERLLTTKYFDSGGETNKSQLAFDVAGTAAAYSLIVTSHLPTAVIASIVLGIYSLLLTNWNGNKKALLLFGCGISLGLFSSSWFWFRMLSELDWIQAGEKVSSAYYDYRNNFLFSPYSTVNLNNWFGSLLLALTLGFFLPTVNLWAQIFKRQPLSENLKGVVNGLAETQIIKKRFRVIFSVIAFSVFMTTDLSRPVWSIIPTLQNIQFPYRWLGIASVAICPLVAVSLILWIRFVKRNGLRPLVLLLLIGFSLLVFFTLKELVHDSDFISRKEFLEKIEASRGGLSFSEWLPKDARELKDLKPMNGNVDAGTRKVTLNSWASHKRGFSIEEGNETIIRIRTFNYPLWKAYLINDGQRIPTSTSSEIDGTLLVAAPSQKSDVEIVFEEPLRTSIALWVSLVGWIVIFGFLSQGIGKRKDI